MQPILTGVANSKSLLINPGARLTIPAGITLNVCENFTNLGVLNADPASTVTFWNGLNQNMNGNLVGANGFGNLTVSKTGGTVTQLQPVDVKSVFTLGNPTSIYNVNGRVHRVAGNFMNFGVYNPVAGTLELNGSALQSYRNFDPINNVVINNTGPGISLTTNMILGSTGNLSLLNGRVITSPSFEVSVNNRTPAAVSVGNPSSFVQGFLRRYLNSTGSYDFPVGDAAKGYQRVNINFTYPANPTLIDNLRVNFAPYASLPTPLGVIDCSLTYSSNALDNGRWIFSASNNSTSGNFDLTLYNTGFTNSANAWTIMSNSGGPWTLANGTCVLSPVAAVRRNAMNGLYEFGTAQGPSTLPVHWLSVDAVPLDDRIRVNWVTATEVNNNGFEVEKLNESSNHFESIAWLNGAGNSNQVNNYSFDDANVEFNEDYFYKIKQVDFNGTISYSGIVHARIKHQEDSKIQLFPNPITPESKLVFDLDHSTSVKISIVNVLGEVLMQDDLGRLKQGNYNINITSLFANLRVGLYTVSVEMDAHFEHLKVLYINQ